MKKIEKLFESIDRHFVKIEARIDQIMGVALKNDLKQVKLEMKGLRLSDKVTKSDLKEIRSDFEAEGRSEDS